MNPWNEVDPCVTFVSTSLLVGHSSYSFGFIDTIIGLLQVSNEVTSFAANAIDLKEHVSSETHHPMP